MDYIARAGGTQYFFFLLFVCLNHKFTTPTIYSIVFCVFVFTGKDIGEDCRNVAWKGAALIAGSRIQRDKWMTREEYFDDGKVPGGKGFGADYINTKVLAATDFS